LPLNQMVLPLANCRYRLPLENGLCWIFPDWLVSLQRSGGGDI